MCDSGISTQPDNDVFPRTAKSDYHSTVGELGNGGEPYLVAFRGIFNSHHHHHQHHLRADGSAGLNYFRAPSRRPRYRGAGRLHSMHVLWHWSLEGSGFAGLHGAAFAQGQWILTSMAACKSQGASTLPLARSPSLHSALLSNLAEDGGSRWAKWRKPWAPWTLGRA